MGYLLIDFRGREVERRERESERGDAFYSDLGFRFEVFDLSSEGC